MDQMTKTGDPNPRHDDLQNGLRIFKALAALRRDGLSKLLPGAILPYVVHFSDPTDCFTIYSQVADVERRLRQYEQAIRHLEEALQIAEREGRVEWQVEALLGLHNVTWQRDPDKSLGDYLRRVRALCEARLPARLPDVLYEMGFTYRLKQNVAEAIRWYDRAEQEWHRQAERDRSDARLATILNDRGYAYSLRGDLQRAKHDLDEALRLRVQAFEDLDKRTRELRRRLRSAAPDQQAALRQQLADLLPSLSRAHVQVGYSYNTSAEIARFGSHFREAIEYHSKALAIFEDENSYYWQTKVLTTRGDVRRRLMLRELQHGDRPSANKLFRQGEEDLEKSLYLCERSNILSGRATAYRNLARLRHEHAIRLIEDRRHSAALKQILEVRTLLEHALRFARETRDAFEELNTLTNMAFLADDLAVIKPSEAERLYLETIPQLEGALEAEARKAAPLYQLEVFHNLLKTERAAYAYVHGRFDEALELYVEAYTGLASDPGYGSSRYQFDFRHLTGRIERLPSADLALAWCDRFIQAWQTHTMQDWEPPQTLAQAHPEMIAWCQRHKAIRDKRP